MTIKEFERLQNRLDRPFGMWNCRHNWHYIIMGVSEPAYTDEELRQYRDNSNELITIDGVKKTRYEWSQEQRRVETAIRRQKDVGVAAQASGDNVLRREAQTNINALTEYYKKISEKSGLATDFSRTRVEGFKEMGKRELQKAAGSGTITVAGQTVNARIRSQKQQEHIFGSKAFERRTKMAKTENKNLPSAFYEGIDVDKLVKTHLGTGTPSINKDGSIVEYFNLDEKVGLAWLPASQEYIPTSRVCVRYSKSGWHAFPVKEGK